MERIEELSQFLTHLSLSQYAAVFQKEGATCVEDLKMFSEEELHKNLGVGKIHAKRLFRKLHPSEEGEGEGEVEKLPKEETAQATQKESIDWDDYCDNNDDSAVFFVVDTNGKLDVWSEVDIGIYYNYHGPCFSDTPFPEYVQDEKKAPVPICLTLGQYEDWRMIYEKHQLREAKLIKEKDDLLLQLEEKMAQIERARLTLASQSEFFSFKTGKCVTLFYFSIKGNLQRFRNIIILFSYEGTRNIELEAGIMEKLKKFYFENYPEINRYSGFEIFDVFSKTIYESEGPVKIKTVKDDYNEFNNTDPSRSLEIEQVPKVGKETKILFYDTKEKNISTLEKLQEEKFLFTFDQLLDETHFPNVTSWDLFKKQKFEFEKDIHGNPCTRIPPKLKLTEGLQLLF